MFFREPAAGFDTRLGGCTLRSMSARPSARPLFAIGLVLAAAACSSDAHDASETDGDRSDGSVDAPRSNPISSGNGGARLMDASAGGTRDASTGADAAVPKMHDADSAPDAPPGVSPA